MSLESSALEGYIAGLLIGCGVAPDAAWVEAGRVVGRCGAENPVKSLRPEASAVAPPGTAIDEIPTPKQVCTDQALLKKLNRSALTVWRVFADASPVDRAWIIMPHTEIAATAGISKQAVKPAIDKLVDLDIVEKQGRTSGQRHRILLWPPAPGGWQPDVGQLAARRPTVRRRFTQHFDANPAQVTGLDDDHPAIVEGHTRFPTTVTEVMAAPRLLISGDNHRKLGHQIIKGPWAGMPIFTLVLEERATCPTSCHHWTTCYGNGMPGARRHRHGPDLEAGLETELAKLGDDNPQGFVVRLHMLGDFYNPEYVDCWGVWLMTVSALRVFGYTAWPPDSEIGARVASLNEQYPERWAVRFSSPEPRPGGATTIWYKPDRPTVPEGIVCPAQTGATECCGTCGLCWHPAARDKTIVFIAHGSRLGGRPQAPRDTEAPKKPWPAELRPSTPQTMPRVELHRDDKPFEKPLNRRCACGGVFESRSMADTVCPACLARRRTIA